MSPGRLRSKEMTVTDEDLDRAAAILRMGGLVAFPTETVYGLGANALDREAVMKIYAAKGRPPTSPLIVHVATMEMLQDIAADWPAAAQQLAERFWPGPLTLIVRKTEKVPSEVTAGLDTVGIRMPAHPVARELIRRAEIPVAAPSANLFTHVSPTTAEHVRSSLGDRVEMILDGGPCQVGIESTVLSLAGPTPALLRPGMIGLAELRALLGKVDTPTHESGNAHASPGLHYRHYSPRTPLYLLAEGDPLPAGPGKVLDMPKIAETYAACLYSALHAADAEEWDWIAFRKPPETPEWAAIRDRLQRASIKSPAKKKS
jgi:L-threonylcarbamoyladenylate synthase